MAVWKPEQMNEAFATAYNSGDLDQLLALYEPTAIHVAKNKQIAKGIDEIRQDLQGLLALNGRMVSHNQYAIVNDDLALLQAHFILKDIKSDEVLAEGITSEMIRKQTDGSWRYVVDHPFSTMPFN
ncbi:Ketosteroid isomerase homolog [Seinonella peptonophila]|uniref:Ketosteroid isomerase homolog n=1 Tax=Seinonella peptonophila TaxID=112248 RepID=A0A1M4WNL3_9BACL|nr:nuclear transport factor 2 family protein [Seinonella peptonophila]SHE82633.1 Ketosteroid isomerase homolog [Seinonella peptonophila]